MLKEDFLSLKNKLVNIAVEFERLQRKSNFLKQTYLLELSDEIKREFNYRSENDIMLIAIKGKKDGLTLKDINRAIAQGKSDLAVKNKNFEMQLASAVALSERCQKYSKEDMEQLDYDFASFCSEFHPVIMAKSSDYERNIYAALAEFYRNGRVEDFYNLLNENKANLVISIPNEDSYDGLSYFYNESIENLNNLVEKMKNSFPLNIEEEFASYDSITALIGNKREEVYDLREMNKALKLDYYNVFGKEF